MYNPAETRKTRSNDAQEKHNTRRRKKDETVPACVLFIAVWSSLQNHDAILLGSGSHLPHKLIGNGDPRVIRKHRLSSYVLSR
jgi:hypothetical protein